MGSSLKFGEPVINLTPASPERQIFDRVDCREYPRLEHIKIVDFKTSYDIPKESWIWKGNESIWTHRASHNNI